MVQRFLIDVIGWMDERMELLVRGCGGVELILFWDTLSFGAIRHLLIIISSYSYIHCCPFIIY